MNENIETNAREAEVKDTNANGMNKEINIEDLEEARKAKQPDQESDASEQEASGLEGEEDLNSEGTESDDDGFKEKYYYVLAELDNFRKRMQREKQDLLKYGSEKILQDLLGVMDSFELTLNALKMDEDDKVKNIVVGIEMVRKQFSETLSQHGLNRVSTVGENFDPNFHEAISQGEEEGKKSGEILSEQAGGYTLNGRLIRAAKVTVQK